MNERLRLNSDLIRTELNKEGRKQSWLAVKLGVSGSLVDKMLCEGHIPKAKTLSQLAALLGIRELELLIPKEAKAG
jgi:ribosome-binding protein aMBF1 (putative translation factor)